MKTGAMVLAAALAALGCGGRTTADATHPLDAGSDLPMADSATPGAPRVMADAQKLALGIAVDEARVWWTTIDGGEVLSCALAGCLAPETIATGQQRPGAVEVDQHSVYWTSFYGDQVLRCAKQSCGTPEVIATGQDGPLDLELGLGALFWTNFEDGRVMKAALDSSSVVTVHAGGQRPSGVTATSSHLVWTDVGDDSLLACTAGDCAGTPTTLTTGEARPQVVTASGTSLYWANTESGEIVSCEIAGCSATRKVLAGGQASPVGVAVFAGRLYWANQGSMSDDGAILSCELPACDDVLVVSSSERTPTFLASGPSALCWTAQGTAAAGFADGIVSCIALEVGSK